MPSEGVGSLYGGLAQGIFGRLREHEDEQKKQDFEQKGQTLKYLSSLVDEATPETRPILLNTMAETIGLKGKHRGVWDMLTGGGRDDYHQQLSGLLSKTTGNIVGPEEYDRRKPDLPMPGKTALDPVTPGKLDQRTGQEIVLRDSDQIALGKLRAQYGLQHENAMTKLYENQRLTSEKAYGLEAERQQGRLDMASKGAELKAQGEILKRAHAKALAKGLAQPGEDDLMSAAMEAGVALGDKDAAQRALTTLRGAQTGEAKAKERYYGQVDPNTGLLGGRPMSEGEKVTRDQSNQGAGIKVYGDWNAARSKAVAIGERLQALHDSIKKGAEGQGLLYDAAKGQFLSKDGKPVSPLIASLYEDQLSEARKLTESKRLAEEEMGGHHRTLSTQFGSLYSPGKDAWWIEPRADMGGVAPAGAPRTGQSFDATTKPGANIADMQEVIGSEARPSSNYRVGQIVPIGGMKYKVTSVTPPTADRPNGSYVIQAIK